MRANKGHETQHFFRAGEHPCQQQVKYIVNNNRVL
jgi:hypothetical protein